MEIILVDPNLVRTFLSNNFLDPNYGVHPPSKIIIFDAHQISIFTVVIS